MVIGVDFDGTLVVGDKAIDGAREAINVLREKGHKIMIFSCNNTKWIEKVLRDNDIRYDYIWGGDKPVCHAYVDDRAIAFRGDWEQTLKELDSASEFNSGKHNGGLW